MDPMGSFKKANHNSGGNVIFADEIPQLDPTCNSSTSLINKRGFYLLPSLGTPVPLVSSRVSSAASPDTKQNQITWMFEVEIKEKHQQMQLWVWKWCSLSLKCKVMTYLSCPEFHWCVAVLLFQKQLKTILLSVISKHDCDMVWEHPTHIHFRCLRFMSILPPDTPTNETIEEFGF